MRLLTFVLLLVFAASLLVAQTTRQDRLDDTSIEEAARTLQNAIRSAVSQAGGDLERQHIHLVLAFSTGHFNKDPLGAQAARQIAWLVVRDLLVEGDRVSCFAWEMSLWDHLQGKDATLIVPGSSPEQKQPINDLFPTTVQDGSQGGHDTERAIVEITGRLGDARDAVIVLLTNDAQSVAPKGQQTLGADNPAYQQVLQTWQRLPQVSKSGASLVLPFKVIRVDGSTAERKLDIVMVAPARFLATTIASQSRSADLQRPAGNRTLPVHLGKPKRIWLWTVLLLVAAAILVIAISKRYRHGFQTLLAGGWRIFRHGFAQRANLILTVNGNPVEMSKDTQTGTICRLVGAQYKTLAEDDIPRIVVDEDSADNIAEIVAQKKSIVFTPRKGKILQVDGNIVLNEPFSLKAGEEKKVILELKGQEPIGITKKIKVVIGWQPVEAVPVEKDSKP